MLSRPVVIGAQLIGNAPPLGPGGLGVLLGESGGDEGRHHPPALAFGAGQKRAHEMHLIALRKAETISITAPGDVSFPLRSGR